MNFWNNPENNSLKVILLVLVVAGAGYFAFQYMHSDSLEGNGRVLNTAQLRDNAGQPVSAQNGDLIFSQITEGNNCTWTVTNATDLNQKISVAGMLSADGDCTPNTQQDNPVSQGMADAMMAGSTATTNPEMRSGLIFSQTVNGTICTMTITNNLNRTESIAVSGTLKGEDCVPNAKQANAVSQGMANAMLSGASVR